ncbi:MAG TPA: metal-dependent hydrolase, partial [Pseudoxanthomonas sp.]|nr:metal-dependent hydrolase [Pseudoxanthomonas sp.]
VLPVVAWLIWWLCRNRGKRVAEAPARWFWSILLALVTHPLLDAFTVYGTQLLWPMHTPPVMWSSVFIIDPLYTVWLLVGCVIAWLAKERLLAQRALLAGLLVSTAYLGWSLAAKAIVDHRAGQDLAALGLEGAPRFSVPMPFNTLLWRVVAMTPDGYVIGDRSLVADRGPMSFKGYKSNVQALAEAQNIEAVQQLGWFNHGFMRARITDGKLVLSDLRMGLEPDYSFNFIVAERAADSEWQAIPPTQQQTAYRAPVAKGELKETLQALWRRIWVQPPAGDAPVADRRPQ